MKPLYKVLIVVAILWGITIVSLIGGNSNSGSVSGVKPTPSIVLSRIGDIIRRHFDDAMVIDSPNITAQFDMLEDFSGYTPAMTALRVIEAVCDLRARGYEDRSMRFIAKINVVFTDGSKGAEDGMNVIFYPESAPNLDCDNPRTVAADTWLKLIPDLAGSFSLHELLE